MENKKALLETIRQDEISKISKPFRNISNVTIESTSTIQISFKIKRGITYKEFKSQKIVKAFFVLLIIAIFIIPAKQIFNNSFSNLPHLLFLLIPGLIFISILIWMFFLNKNLNYRIYIDKTGILINNKLYKWTDIYDTAILSSGNGRGRTEYLIIILNNKEHYEQFNLRNFSGFKFYSIGFRIATYIELFKSYSPLQ